MTIKSKLTGLGLPAALATNIAGTVNTTEVSVGNASTNALLLSFDDYHVINSGSGSTGVILPPGNGTASGLSAGDSMTIANYTGNTIAVYPPLGGKLNNGSANAGINITNTKSVDCFCIDNLNFIVSSGA